MAEGGCVAWMFEAWRLDLPLLLLLGGYRGGVLLVMSAVGVQREHA